MSRVQLSIVIPARNEMFLSRTVRDIVEHKRGKTEILVGLDGAKADPLIDEHPDVTIVYRSESIGQRAMTNQLVRLSRAKYIMKLDAHCSVDEGFDVKMMGDMQDHWTMVPVMKNFHVFDWVCKKCGDRRYQGPTPTECPKCDNKTEFERDIVWIAKNNPQSTSYCFDSEPHFQYFREFKDRPEYKKSLGESGLTETMSLQGSCWMVTRDKYWELDLCDETWENWGSQGIQVAVSTWLSGGRVICNLKTWYSHMFRTKGGNFSFPWPCSGRQVQRAKKHARDLFYNNKFPKQIYPSSWLLDKFWVVPGWNDEARAKITEAGVTFTTFRKADSSLIGTENKPDAPVSSPPSGKDGLVVSVAPSLVDSSTDGITSNVSSLKLRKCIIYYSDCQLDPTIMQAVQKQLLRSLNGNELISVTLKPIDFGKNIVLPLKRSHLSMARQQLAGLEATTADIIFFAEHDILYPKEHFDFLPPRKDVFFYNLNWVKVRTSDGQALSFKAKQVSGLCAYRNILLDYYRKRVSMIESGEIGGRRHFEPGSNHYKDAYDKLTSLGSDTWQSSIPYVDIRHEGTVTRNIFDPSGYRNTMKDWTMMDEIPGGWGKTKGRFWEFLREAVDAI